MSSGGGNGPVLRAADGTALATRCWPSATDARAIVVIAHGFTANKDDPKVVALAERLHQDGYEVVAYDSRGHGESGGHCTLGKLEDQDVAAVVEWARHRAPTVVLVGASMGAVGALSYAARDSGLAGVVTVSSPGEWKLPLRIRSFITAAIARTTPGRRWAERTIGVRIAPWASPDPATAHLDAVRCPVIVIHGRDDPIIPWRSSLARKVIGGPQREVILVPGMGHAFDPAGISWIRDATARLVEASARSPRSTSWVLN
jgi:alpha-beta hydrolase superfamily lysophospholipase